MKILTVILIISITIKNIGAAVKLFHFSYIDIKKIYIILLIFIITTMIVKIMNFYHVIQEINFIGFSWNWIARKYCCTVENNRQGNFGIYETHWEKNLLDDEKLINNEKLQIVVHDNVDRSSTLPLHESSPFWGIVKHANRWRNLRIDPPQRKSDKCACGGGAWSS